MAMSQEDVQNEIAQAQQLQQQLQNIVAQKQQLEVTKKDTERALEELKKLENETPVYKNVGENILIQVEDKDKLVEDLEDELESTDVRIKTMDKQEEKLRKKFQQIQQQLTAKLGGAQQGSMGGN